MAGATTRPTQPKNSSGRKPTPVSLRKHHARVEAVPVKGRHKSKTKSGRAQQVIQGDRARQIQIALIREGYMKGEPSGVWDQSTKDAMTRYQADHGWQTKTLPDSRALIQLGLGPSHEDAAKAMPASLPAKTEPVKASALPQPQQ